MPRLWTVIALLALALVATGCKGKDESDGQGDEAKPTVEQREEAARKRDDREFDRSFDESAFERVVAKLPIGEPPLYVRQYISDEGNRLYTAVGRKRFCRATPGERKQAVTSFYEAADRAFRRAGVEDFEQVVTPLSENVDKLPALATAREGTVALTRRGRRC